jgi:hypothetical protein
MILLTVRGEPAAMAVSIPPAPAMFAWLLVGLINGAFMQC